VKDDNETIFSGAKEMGFQALIIGGAPEIPERIQKFATKTQEWRKTYQVGGEPLEHPMTKNKNPLRSTKRFINGIPPNGFTDLSECSIGKFTFKVILPSFTTDS